jgi:gluconokinase
MTDQPRVRHVVVMGVSGVGKTTVAKGISTLTGWTFSEGDAFHSDANVAKMRDGQALTDEDRWPWLRSIGEWISEEIDAGRSAVITCSALRRAYRDVLREGRPEVEFCHLVAEAGLVGDRMEHRQGHYMPRSLLDSQYATLEPLESDEPGVEVSVEGAVPEVMHRAMDALGLPYLDV